MTMTLAGGYDDNVFADVSGGGVGVVGSATQSGQYGHIAGGLSYSLNTPRVAFNASAGTSGRYFPDLPKRFVGTHNGNIATSLQLAKGTRVEASQTITYQPFLTLNLIPLLFDATVTQAAPAGQEFSTRLDESKFLAYGTGVSLSHSVSRRGTLSFNYGLQLSDLADGDRFTVQTGAGRFSLAVARGLAVRVGYGYSEARYPGLLCARKRAWQRATASITKKSPSARI
jgi:hypothetical protein